MAFPFIPFGALMAALVLGGTFVLFIGALNRIDRTITDVGGSVVGRLVSGLGDWSHERGDDHGSGSGGGVDHGTVDGADGAGDDPFEAASPAPVEPARVIRH